MLFEYIACSLFSWVQKHGRVQYSPNIHSYYNSSISPEICCICTVSPETPVLFIYWFYWSKGRNMLYRQQSKQASKQNPAAHCCRCRHPSCGCRGRPRASSRPGGARRQSRQGAWGRKHSNSKAATRGAGAPPIECAGQRSLERLDTISEGAWNALSAFSSVPSLSTYFNNTGSITRPNLNPL